MKDKCRIKVSKNVKNNLIYSVIVHLFCKLHPLRVVHLFSKINVGVLKNQSQT